MGRQATPDGAFTLAVLGDMGLNNSAATMARLKSNSHRYNATLHTGDIS